MNTPESGRHEFTAAEIIERTAEAAIAYVTREKAAVSGTSVDTLSWDDFLDTAVESTQAECLYMTALTGLFLIAGHPDMFSEMLLVQSYLPKLDTQEGREESEIWNFDTWLVVKTKPRQGEDTEGRYYTTSPPLHHTPKINEFVKVYSGKDMETVLGAIERKRPGWTWPRASDVRKHEFEMPRGIEHFYHFDPATGEHRFNRIAIFQYVDSILLDTHPYILGSMAPVE